MRSPPRKRERRERGRGKERRGILGANDTFERGVFSTDRVSFVVRPRRRRRRSSRDLVSSALISYRLKWDFTGKKINK